MTVIIDQVNAYQYTMFEDTAQNHMSYCLETDFHYGASLSEINLTPKPILTFISRSYVKLSLIH